MMDHIQANALMDLYGPFLTRRQNEILSMYFQEDLSLSEIQEQLEISRSAILDSIQKGLKNMESCEEKLHLLQKNEKIHQMILQYPQLKKELEALLF